ncbi:hypothetical protein BU23DRAFT_562723 [Bimuria novae-zelandiae CBS 107.79]|uniref:Uncharacterized protein n=1 Tax=Bimuria novae-zelandiae CBS 107.79 TaxID=1447943 RepID=A0A6A5VRL9_9PLEO|nr:hypothetical protein BU23DRAFT_562723 [Bimuria novae-zelandiae CBS 107.79]
MDYDSNLSPMFPSEQSLSRGSVRRDDYLPHFQTEPSYTSAHHASQSSRAEYGSPYDISDDISDSDDNDSVTTDIADPTIISISVTYTPPGAPRLKRHIGIDCVKLATAQQQGYAYIGRKTCTTAKAEEPEVAARGRKDAKVLVEWRKAKINGTNCYVTGDVLKTEVVIEKAGDPPLFFELELEKAEVNDPTPSNAQAPDLFGKDMGTGGRRGFLPPVKGMFSEEEVQKFEGKRVLWRVLKMARLSASCRGGGNGMGC